MKFFRLLTHHIYIRPLEKITRIIRDLPITEKVLFFGACGVMVVSAILLLFVVNAQFQTEIPTQGGTLTEGVVGTPRFINPILAISDADRDLTELVYSGLLDIDASGSYIADLAESWSISDDGRTYSFALRDDAVFHDGEPVTTEDIAFTIAMAQDPLLKSPKRVNWEGVTVRVISPREIEFILSESYEPFIENLTLGILPRHLWRDVTPDQFPFSRSNIEPIGSGPYVIDNIRTNSSNLPTQYELSPFVNYTLGEPFIKTLIVRIYPNEDRLTEAYKKGTIDSVSGLTRDQATELSLESEIVISELPRVFGVFFNQNQAPVLLNKEVRQALSLAIDRDAIVSEVFGQFARPTNTALPFQNIEQTTTASTTLDEARTLLEDEGWAVDEESGIYTRDTDDGIERLSFSISTANTPELIRTAEIIEAQWESFGANIELKIFDINDLNQRVIRPRNYETLLFGQVIGRGQDLYPFWHSSQRNDPGLNISQYTNITVDKLVEDARVTFDKSQRANLLTEFVTELQNDTPAVFIYSPYFTYALPNKVSNAFIGNVVLPSDRFNNIHEWYIETTRIWNIFVE